MSGSEQLGPPVHDFDAVDMIVGHERLLDVPTVADLANRFDLKGMSPIFALSYSLGELVAELRDDFLDGRLKLPADDAEKLVKDFVLRREPLDHARWVVADGEEGEVNMSFVFGFDKFGWKSKVESWTLARACEQHAGVEPDTFKPKGPRPRKEDFGGTVVKEFAIGADLRVLRTKLAGEDRWREVIYDDTGIAPGDFVQK